MFQKLTRFALSFSLLATLLVGVSVATIAPAQAVATCAAGGVCVVGDTGPGGGTVYYVADAAFTSTGSDCGASCKYLEVAPVTWAGGFSDSTAVWAPANSLLGANGFLLGKGYANTSLIVAASSGANTAAVLSRNYRGGTKSDWSLPSDQEFTLLCQWATIGTPNPYGVCDGTLPLQRGNLDASKPYWLSRESSVTPTQAWVYVLTSGGRGLSGSNKQFATAFRPVRAFGSAPAKVDQATLTVKPASGTYGSTVTLESSGGSGTGSVTFTTTSTSCSILGTTLSVSAAVTCAVVATKAADLTYNVATSAAANIVFAGGSRTLTIDSGSYTSDGYSILASPPTLTATVSIGTGAKTFTSSTAGICTVDSSSGVVVFVTSGTCTVSASIAADASYASVNSSAISFSINKIAQSITFGTLANKTFGASPFTVSGSATSSLSLTFSSATPSVCTVVSPTITIVAGGTCTINADQAGDSTYAIATQVAQSFTVAVAAQVITFGAPGDVAYGSPGPVTLVATSTSSLTVTFSSATTEVCTVSGTSVTRIATGTCTINADQAGNGSYSAASRVVRSFAVTKANPSVSLQYPNSNTVTFSVGGTLSPSSFSSTSGGVISFSTTSTACSIDPVTAVISILGAGDCNAYINVTEFGNYLARSSFTKVTIAGLTGLTPVLELAAAKPGGFVVNINNYNADYGFTATVDTGTVTAVLISTTVLRITVSGVPAGTSATLSITTTKTGYAPVTSTVAGTALSNKTVTFKPNFVAAAPLDVTQISAGPSNLVDYPFTRPNFTFTGWNTLANGLGTTYANQASYDFSADIPLYAQWVQNSLSGVNPADLGFVASITAGVIDSTFTGSTSGSTVSVTYLSGGLPDGTTINIHLLRDTSRASSLISTASNFILSLIVSWIAPDGTVPTTVSGKALSMTISNASIRKGASIYSLIGNIVRPLGTAIVDGSVTVSISEDPEILVAITKPEAPTGVAATNGANTVSTVTWSAPAVNGGADITGYVVTSSGGQTCSPSSVLTLSCDVTGLTNGVDYTFTVTATNSEGTSIPSAATSAVRPLAPVVTTTPAPAPTGGGGGAYIAPTPDPAIAAAAEAHAAAEFKAAQDKALAEAEFAAAVKAAAQIIDAQAKAAAELKASNEKVAQDMRIADELRVAQEKADSDLRIAAERKATEDVAAAALLAARKIAPMLTMYSISASLKLSKYDSAYLKKYVSKLKPKAKVICVGYIYTKNSSYAKAKALAGSQAKAVCAMIKAQRKTILTSILLYPASKASPAATGAKWVAVSYRVDGFRP